MWKQEDLLRFRYIKCHCKIHAKIRNEDSVSQREQLGVPVDENIAFIGRMVGVDFAVFMHGGGHFEVGMEAPGPLKPSSSAFLQGVFRRAAPAVPPPQLALAFTHCRNRTFVVFYDF